MRMVLRIKTNVLALQKSLFLTLGASALGIAAITPGLGSPLCLAASDAASPQVAETSTSTTPDSAQTPSAKTPSPQTRGAQSAAPAASTSPPQQARPAAGPSGARVGDFKPSEEISEDFAVPFPVDI